MSRKTAREMAFKVIFATNFQIEDELETVIEGLLEDDERITDINNEDMNYIKDIANGVSKNVAVLDEKIKKYLKGWTMDRIPKTDLAILRLAIYEILFRDDIPFKVSVNEAVELAKTFSDDQSPSFVNGVLAGVVNE